MTWRAVLAGSLTVAAIVTIGIASVGSSEKAPAAANDAPAAPAAMPMGVPATPSDAPQAPCIPPGYAGDGPLPTVLRVPKIGVVSNLEPMCLNPDGSVQVPPTSAPELTGWFALHPRPGDIGSAVLISHVDGDGRLGSGHDINKMKAGDKIYVARADGSTVTFAVTKVATYTKDNFPSRTIYGPTKGPELRWISCTGPFDKATRQYKDNIVAFAKLVKS